MVHWLVTLYCFKLTYFSRISLGGSLSEQIDRGFWVECPHLASEHFVFFYHNKYNSQFVYVLTPLRYLLAKCTHKLVTTIEEIGYTPRQNLVLHCSLLLLQIPISSTGGSTLLQYLPTAFSVSVIIRSATDGSFSQNYRSVLIYFSNNYILNVHYL